MKFIPTELPEVIVIEPDVHHDHRGFFFESYHLRKYAHAGIEGNFVQDNHSRSVRGTLRGLHAQVRRPQAKLVRVLQGAIYDVAVDVRPDSPTFGRWVGVDLSAENFRQCFIPAGFAHGFVVLSDLADVEYKCTDFYDPGGEISILWNDPDIGIRWPAEAPILSEKDRKAERLRDVLDLLRYAGQGLVWPTRP